MNGMSDDIINLLRTPDVNFLSNASVCIVRLTEKYKIIILKFSYPVLCMVSMNKDFHNDKLVTC
jgi:hypothetical protein